MEEPVEAVMGEGGDVEVVMDEIAMGVGSDGWRWVEVVMVMGGGGHGDGWLLVMLMVQP